MEVKQIFELMNTVTNEVLGKENIVAEDLSNKESFSSAEQLNGFISMIYNEIDKSMTVKIDSLVMRTIANMIGMTVYSDYQATSQSEKSGVKAINLLKLYKDRNATATDLTPASALTNPDFIRFASDMMGMYERLAKITHETHRHGNIGVTTNQQLLEEERKLWTWNFYNHVFADVDKSLTINIY